jgi:glycosyltransferase involved in cell wall biosynthesis
VVARLNGTAAYFAAEMGRRPHWLTMRLEANSLRRADFWCSVSHYTAQRTKSIFGLSSGPHAILPNPVHVGPPVPWAGRRPGMVVFTGTLTEKKGVVQLVDAWRRVAPRFPEATLHLVGKDGTAPGGGSMAEYLRARLEGVSLERARFHGRVPHEHVVELLAEARVAVLPSFSEALAIAPLEAMAAGCPTIGSALGSGPELIESEVDGLTVDPRRPEEIEFGIRRLLEDETLAERLGQNGRRKVEGRFSIDHLLPANVRFYETCIARHVVESGAGHEGWPLPKGEGEASEMRGR